MKDKNQVPDYTRERDNGFIPDAVYNSETPIRVVPPDDSTTITTEDCWCDPVARQVRMSNEEQLAFKMKAFNAAEPWVLDGQANELPHFQAGEVEDDATPNEGNK